MATYNGGAYIKEQVESILRQVGVDVFLYYSDDGSNDDTLEILRRYENLSETRMIQLVPIRRGGNASRNFLRMLIEAELSEYDYVAFSDQDDVWDSHKLSRGITALVSSGCAGYSSAVTAFWPSGAVKTLVQNPKIRKGDFLFEGAGQGCTFILPYKSVAQLVPIVKQNWESLGAIHYHDWLIYGICRAAGLSWHFDSHSTMRYRQHGGNDTGARGSISALKKRLVLAFNGWYSDQILQIASICATAFPSAIAPSQYLMLSSFRSKHSILGSSRLALFVFYNGRRRFSDRMVLVAMALTGRLK